MGSHCSTASGTHLVWNHPSKLWTSHLLCSSVLCGTQDGSTGVIRSSSDHSCTSVICCPCILGSRDHSCTSVIRCPCILGSRDHSCCSSVIRCPCILSSCELWNKLRIASVIWRSTSVIWILWW